MSGNIIALVVAVGLSGVIYWAESRNPQQSVENLRWFALFEWIIALFLLVNALLAYAGWRSVRQVYEITPVTSESDLMKVENQQDVLLLGFVSENNSIVKDETIVAYFECDGTCDFYINPPLQVDLKFGKALIDDRSFEQREWLYEKRFNTGYFSLMVGDEVAVIGRTADSVSSAGESSRNIDAEIIYRGGYDELVARAKQKAITPLALLIINAVIAAALVGLGFGYWQPPE